MKKLLIFLLILALMLPIVSCAKPETPPSEPQDSGSDSGSDSGPETVSHFPKERKLIVHSGTESFIPKSLFDWGYFKPQPDDGLYVSYSFPPDLNAFYAISSSITDGFPTLYWNGELSIEVSEDCERFFILVANYDDEGNLPELCPEWDSITLEELNSLGTGTWYVNISASWNGDYYPEYEKYEIAKNEYVFALVVDQSYDRDLSLRSKTDIFKLGEIEEIIDLYLLEDPEYKDRILARYQRRFDQYLQSCKWVPDAIVRPDMLYEMLDGLTVLEAELYDTGDGGENPRMVLYRYSLPTVYEDGRMPEFIVREYDLTVLHGDVNTFMTEEERAVFETGHAILNEHEGEDLRFCQAEGIVDYYRDGIRYTYANGELTEIHWQSGDTKFWLGMTPAYFTMTESDWENITSPILKRFLDKDQTATAISWFDELIKSEERAET